MDVDELTRQFLQSFDRLGLSRLAPDDLIADSSRHGDFTRAAAAEATAQLVANGYLLEFAGHFERTELGRLEIAPANELTLLSRDGCTLCHKAVHQIEPVAASFGAPLRIVNIDTDRTLRARYGNDIPVLFLGNREVARHRVDPQELRRELKQARTPL